MPNPSLIDAFDLVPLLIEMALSSAAEVLPGATVLETAGKMNEDWLGGSQRARRPGWD